MEFNISLIEKARSFISSFLSENCGTIIFLPSAGFILLVTFANFLIGLTIFADKYIETHTVKNKARKKILKMVITTRAILLTVYLMEKENILILRAML